MPEPPPTDLQAMTAFAEKCDNFDDMIFGITIFYDAMMLLHRQQDEQLASDRRQIQQMIRTGLTASQQARELLEKVRHNPARADELSRFLFPSLNEHPQPAALRQRAGILAQTYTQMFPGRPRWQTLTSAETLHLLEHAADVLEEERHDTDS